jgi:hypothetical protein
MKKRIERLRRNTLNKKKWAMIQARKRRRNKGRNLHKKLTQKLKNL